jgi:hypothetical protein
VFWAKATFAATATFAPVGATHVPRGDPISFTVTVTASPAGFNSADIVIGSVDANNLTFAYSPQWLSAFANITPVSYDNGFYMQDVFVGGNNASSVGQSLLLGTITVDTANMSVGPHAVTVDHAIDGVSTLGLAGMPQPLSGSVSFQVTPPIPATTTWGLAVLVLCVCICGTLLTQKRIAQSAHQR